LKEYTNAYSRVYVVAYHESKHDELDYRRIEWSVSNETQTGDLILIYRTAPVSAICDLWVVEVKIRRYSTKNRQGRYPGRQAQMRRIAKLSRPLSLDLLKRHPRTREMAVVRKRFQGKTDITLDWFLLESILLELNPRLKKTLRRFSPN